jgi:hypothetical protein
MLSKTKTLMPLYRSILACLLMLSGPCIAQHHMKANTLVKLNVGAALDVFTFPTLQVAVEQKLYKKWSVEAEFGYQLYDLLPHDTSFIDPSGFKALLSVRYYFRNSRRNELTGFYVGLNPFYRQNKYNKDLPYSDNNDNDHWDALWSEKKCYGFNLLAGYQRNIGKLVYFNVYGGLGPMYRHITNHNREFDRDQGHYFTGRDLVPYFASLNLSDENGWNASFALGVKFGIRLF